MAKGDDIGGGGGMQAGGGFQQMIQNLLQQRQQQSGMGINNGMNQGMAGPSPNMMNPLYQKIVRNRQMQQQGPAAGTMPVGPRTPMNTGY